MKQRQSGRVVLGAGVLTWRSWVPGLHPVTSEICSSVVLRSLIFFTFFLEATSHYHGLLPRHSLKKFVLQAAALLGKKSFGEGGIVSFRCVAFRLSYVIETTPHKMYFTRQHFLHQFCDRRLQEKKHTCNFQYASY